ncbi:TSUP family transporter [Bacillus sp. SCS-153A]|uniref:TSUP family transporter n=1 Tax=Rossellomorea sedimentorum TaxID=3115294 RepID=UPI003906671E
MHPFREKSPCTKGKNPALWIFPIATIYTKSALYKGVSYLKSIAFTRFQTFVSCSAAFLAYLFNGHFIWQAGLAFCLGSIIGAQTAVRFAGRVPLRTAKLMINAMTLILILKIMYSLLL